MGFNFGHTKCVNFTNSNNQREAFPVADSAFYSAQSSRAAIPWQGGRHGSRYALIVYLKCLCLLVATPQNIIADSLKCDIFPFL